MTAQIEATTVDPRYYEAGARWEDEIHRSLRRSRTLAWLLTGLFALIAAGSVTALILVLPLKQFEPYVIEVDRTTGYIEVARALKPGDLSQNEAVTAANIVRYIRARETYDPLQLKANFDLANLYSTGAAADALRNEFSPSNPYSRDKVYGTKSTISVQIKSISFLNRNTATVRFSTDETREGFTNRDHWVGVVKFQYSGVPLKNRYRFDNPLGFQVTDYRRDQESIPEAQSGTRAE